MEESLIKYRIHFKRGARLARKSSDLVGLVPGLHCGYAVTFFDSDIALRKELTHHTYSEIIKRNKWKVGTSEITKTRLATMMKMRIKETDDVWKPYDLPYEKRAAKYVGDLREEVAGHCAFMTDAMLRFDKTGSLAFLMIPILHAFEGGIEPLERHLSYMVDKAGGYVVNNKIAKKEKKPRAPKTEIRITMNDSGIDKLLQLPPELKKLGFLTHPG